MKGRSDIFKYLVEFQQNHDHVMRFWVFYGCQLAKRGSVSTIRKSYAFGNEIKIYENCKITLKLN